MVHVTIDYVLNFFGSWIVLTQATNVYLLPARLCDPEINTIQNHLPSLGQNTIVLLCCTDIRWLIVFLFDPPEQIGGKQNLLFELYSRVCFYTG